jgi:hypothetical protein
MLKVLLSALLLSLGGGHCWCRAQIQDGDWVRLACRGKAIEPSVGQIDWWRVRLKGGICRRGAVIQFESADYSLKNKGFLTAYQQIAGSLRPMSKKYKTFTIDGPDKPIALHEPFMLVAHGRYCTYNEDSQEIVAHRSQADAASFVMTDHFSPATVSGLDDYTLQYEQALLYHDGEQLRLGGVMPQAYSDIQNNPVHRVVLNCLPKKHAGMFGIRFYGVHGRPMLQHSRLTKYIPHFKQHKKKKKRKQASMSFVPQKRKTWDSHFCLKSKKGGKWQQFEFLPCGKEHIVLHNRASSWNGVIKDGALMASFAEYSPLKLQKIAAD